MEFNAHKPELLAPAGDWDALRAAVANGADAVYFGLDQFNARHRAANFTLEELPRLMDFLHTHNVKGFLTFNTLIFSDELEDAAKYVSAIAKAGVDAVLIQDLGLARLVHRLAPSLAIHGSTQMTLTEPRGIAFVKELGVRRVVLARELGLKDITRITHESDMPIEVFVHGALCVAYSGQCLTSESLGGRSANRGQCAQACRLPYQLIVDGQVRDLGDKAYLLSPSDLAAYDMIGDLTRAGVISFKIEGRLKSAHYVAATCQTYREAIDATVRGQSFAITNERRHDLEQTFSRGFTHGFLGGVNHQELVAARFPKARGTRVGVVAEKTARSIIVTIDAAFKGSTVPLKAGDGIVFDEGHPEQDEQGGRVFLAEVCRDGRMELDFRAGDVNLSYINAGAIVWKTDDPHIKRRLEHSYSRDTVSNRIPVAMTVSAHAGELLKLTMCAEGHTAEASWEKPLERAKKFPATEAMLREQLDRLGDTPFAMGELTVDLAGDPMVPKSVLNDLRRQCVERLLRQRAYAHEIIEPDALKTLRQRVQGSPAGVPRSDGPSFYVLVRTLEQLDAVLAHRGPIRPAMIYADFEDVRRYPEAVSRCRTQKMLIALSTLRIVKPGEEGFLKQISDCRPDALLVRCLAAVAYYREQAADVPQIGDYSLNVANELTAGVLAESGLVRMVPSYDLNWMQMAAMIGRMDPAMLECVIHQHMPMFHMEHCVFAHTLSTGKDFHDCGRPCERHKVDLGDRVGEAHPLIPDVGCRNTVYNATAQTAAEYVPEMKRLGIRHFRVELLREDAADAIRIMDRYTRVVCGLETPLQTLRTLRVLNQLGVTRGTLAHE